MLGTGSSEEISRIRRCYPQKNIPDRGSRGQGSWRQIHTGLASSLVAFVAENDSGRSTSCSLYSLPTGSQVEGWGDSGAPA